MSKIASLDVGKRTIVMGILNVTPDSFSDGGEYFSRNKAVEHALEMVEEGADLIDIGGESTRPGAKKISLEEERKRVIPVLKEVIDSVDVPISVDTYKSEIAKEVLDLGAFMINDVTAFRGDNDLLNVIIEHDVPVCIMHMKGTPRNMQVNPHYDDIMGEIRTFLEERIKLFVSKGGKRENIIVDPGIGFGKRTGDGIEDNCEILRNLSVLKDLDCPILVGASRKKFIGNICNGKETLSAKQRLEGSLAANCIAVANGADIVRVHDVKETRRCIDVVDCIVR